MQEARFALNAERDKTVTIHALGDRGSGIG
jgi:hypothetical protein